MTAAAPRQQRRRIEREQIKSGRTLLATGLPPTPKREAMRDIARALKAKLIERDNPLRAGEAAAITQNLFEASLKRYPARVEIACKKGCTYCCHGFVGAVPPEIFRIAHTLSSRMPSGLTRADISAKATLLGSMSPAARVGAKLACPLLIDNACSTYGERPLVCRQATSLMLPACIEEFEGHYGASDKIEVSSAHLTHAGNAHVALLGAMLSADLPTTAYEFASSLDVALSLPDAESRWLAGEEIFRSCKNPVERQPLIDQVAAKIAADLDA